MPRSRLPVRSSIAGLMLGLLLIAVGGAAQTATAQQPVFDSDRPIQSLTQAAVHVESDSQLVALATALQKARADTEISFQEYQEGVHFFQQNHPGFYGNFFGDPVYATYDVRYARLTRERQFAEIKINPQNSVKNNDWFFCSPLTYDPAFNGRCRGFEFLASDFFFLPSGPAFEHQELSSRRVLALTRRDAEPRIRLADSAPNRPDTSRMPDGDAPAPDRPRLDPSASSNVEAADPVVSKSDVDPVSVPDEISVPDKIATPEREAETALDRAEALSRVRELVRRQQNGDRLSAEERREVISTLQHMAERRDTGRRYSGNARSDRHQRRFEPPTDRNREHTGRSPRTPSDVNRPQTDRIGIDRSAPTRVKRNRPDAEPDISSSRSRSNVDRSSGDETEN